MGIFTVVLTVIPPRGWVQESISQPLSYFSGI